MSQKSEENEEVVTKELGEIIVTKLPLVGPKMPVFLKSDTPKEGAYDLATDPSEHRTKQEERRNKQEERRNIRSIVEVVAAILLGLLSLAIPIALTVFATTRNQPGTALYKWMCGFLVLMWCSQLLAPVTMGTSFIGGFVGLVGTIVMIAKGGGCGGCGCAPGQSGFLVVSGSSLSSF